jgi:hypothetical protein
MLRAAALLAGTRLLEGLERYYRKQHGGKLGTAKILAGLLAGGTGDYARLYDACLGRYRGWPRLAREITIEQFDSRMRRRIAEASDVVSLIDYRFRYLEYEKGKRSNANIAHSQVHLWTDRQHQPPTMSRKKILRTWKRFRVSAIPLYVMKQWSPELIPVALGQGDFIDKLKLQASDDRHLAQFFGMCAYVDARLSEPGQGSDLNACLSGVKDLQHVAPNSRPLDPDELSEFLQGYGGSHGSQARFRSS